jgi:hypothetical protein
MTAPIFRLLLFALLLAACSSSDSGDNMSGPDPDPDPDPEFDIDIVRFRVWTLEAPGVEKLRWVGTTEGPLEASPEDTRWPWIGYARAFRVEWKAFSEDDPIRGTQYRVSQSDFGPWLPRERDGTPIWGSDTDFVFENLLEADELGGQSCPEGPDCAGQLRFESGRHRLQVRAVTEADRELDEELGLLEFEINYPPTTEFVEDPATGPENPLSAPVAWWKRVDGSTEYVALAEGDTIPSGASIRVRLRGADRLRSNTAADSFCCDERNDSAVPEVSFQAFTNFIRENPDGVRDSLFTMFGPTATDSIFTMDVGPFDYGAVFRARDEHGRRGDAVGFSFVAGYPPQIPTTGFQDGSSAILSPVRDPQPGEIGFVRAELATLSWDPVLQDWIDDPDLDTTLEGRWYEIPLQFRCEPHPKVRDLSPLAPPEASPFSSGYSDHVRSFAYELIHEDDPDNDLADGPTDRDDLYLTTETLGELELTGEQVWRIFIPDLVFTNLELFDPNGECVGPVPDYCGIGAGLLRRLGEFEFRLRGKTTGATSTFHQEAPQARRDVLMNLTDHGRFSPWMSRTLSVRIATNDDNGQITGIWPPESP